MRTFIFDQKPAHRRCARPHHEENKKDDETGENEREKGSRAAYIENLQEKKTEKMRVGSSMVALHKALPHQKPPANIPCAKRKSVNKIRPNTLRYRDF